MNKLFALAFLGLTSSIAHAQTTPLTKGRGLLSGSIGYHRDSYGSNSTDTFEFAPSVGKFVADNLLLGINTNLILNGYNSDYGAPENTANSFAVGPFARYYNFVGGDKFALFGQGSLGYSHTQLGSFNDATINQGYVSITPGIAFFPVPRFGIEASLRGLSYATNFNQVSSLDLGFSLRNVQIGAAYYFGK
jgi:hypothetical protein